MKHTALLLALSFFPTFLFSQDLNYEVRGTYKRPVTQKALHSPKLMSDVVAGYPVNWISSYRSAEISATCRGKERTAISRNDTLSLEQQEILKTADLASEITITIHYTYTVPVTASVEHNTMRIAMTVVPEREAEYAGGHQELIQYLKANGPQHMTAASGKERGMVLIRFTIDEQGKASNPKIIRSSGDLKTDTLFSELILNMPPWKAAENPKGTRVKQEFEFIAGRGGDGC